MRAAPATAQKMMMYFPRATVAADRAAQEDRYSAADRAKK
jgi:hypothetical protein